MREAIKNRQTLTHVRRFFGFLILNVKFQPIFRNFVFAWLKTADFYENQFL